MLGSSFDVPEGYDFSGYVTKNDILCTDGVTIRHGCFSNNHGQQVPLFLNHDKHNYESMVGHMILEHRDDGVYGYGFFNETPKAQMAKELVRHGDLNSMSIGANQIQRLPNNDVVGGNIREVSLVAWPANAGAKITEVINHSYENGEEAIMYTNGTIEHSAFSGHEDFTLEEVLQTLTDEQAEAVDQLIANTLEDRMEHNDSLDEILDTLTPGQVEAVQEYFGYIMDEISHSDDEDDEVDEDVEAEDEEYVFEEVEDGSLYDPDSIDGLEFDEELGAFIDAQGNVYIEDNTLEQGDNMYNVFEQQDTLNHADAIREELTEAIQIAHSQGRKVSEVLHTERFANADLLEHSISNPNILFPEHKNPQGVQVIYSPNTATEHILSSVTKAPTAFVKSLLTDLSDLSNEELRAKGYIKGSEKKDQIISFLSRKTEPKTIYKKQSIDRDDAIDMGDVLNVAQFFQQELKVKLNDEIARAILVGDGREPGNQYKINESNIRPIKNDDDFYTIKKKYSDNNLIELFETVAMEKTKMLGSGTPSLYVNSQFITKLRFLRNKNENWVFGGQQPATKEYLASLFGVKEIVECDFLQPGELIMVNLADYQVGTNNGGQVTSFEKFDIDYNKQKYLVEARLSGALTRPKAAVYFSTEESKVKPDASAAPKGTE